MPKYHSSVDWLYLSIEEFSIKYDRAGSDQRSAVFGNNTVSDKPAMAEGDNYSQLYAMLAREVGFDKRIQQDLIS